MSDQKYEGISNMQEANKYTGNKRNRTKSKNILKKSFKTMAETIEEAEDTNLKAYYENPKKDTEKFKQEKNTNDTHKVYLNQVISRRFNLLNFPMYPTSDEDISVYLSKKFINENTYFNIDYNYLPCPNTGFTKKELENLNINHLDLVDNKLDYYQSENNSYKIIHSFYKDIQNVIYDIQDNFLKKKENIFSEKDALTLQILIRNCNLFTNFLMQVHYEKFPKIQKLPRFSKSPRKFFKEKNVKILINNNNLFENNNNNNSTNINNNNIANNQNINNINNTLTTTINNGAMQNTSNNQLQSTIINTQNLPNGDLFSGNKLDSNNLISTNTYTATSSTKKNSAFKSLSQLKVSSPQKMRTPLHSHNKPNRSNSLMNSGNNNNPNSALKRTTDSDKKNSSAKSKKSDIYYNINNSLVNNFNSKKGKKLFTAKTVEPTCYKCDFCKREFKNGQALGGHISQAHPQQSNKYKMKLYIRNSRTERREIIYTARQKLFQKYQINLDQLVENDEKKKIKEFLKLHKNEYKKILTYLKMEKGVLPSGSKCTQKKGRFNIRILDFDNIENNEVALDENAEKKEEIN